MRTLLTATFLIVGLTAATGTASATEAGKVILEKWYPALFSADAETLSELLAGDAKIRLEDLGITQTKAEFLDSLDEWEDSIEGAEFDWKLDPNANLSDTEATALVCYTFPDNELMTREVFAFANGLVESSIQSTAGENCEDF